MILQQHPGLRKDSQKKSMEESEEHGFKPIYADMMVSMQFTKVMG